MSQHCSCWGLKAQCKCLLCASDKLPHWQLLQCSSCDFISTQHWCYLPQGGKHQDWRVRQSHANIIPPYLDISCPYSSIGTQSSPSSFKCLIPVWSNFCKLPANSLQDTRHEKTSRSDATWYQTHLADAPNQHAPQPACTTSACAQCKKHEHGAMAVSLVCVLRDHMML